MSIAAERLEELRAADLPHATIEGLPERVQAAIPDDRRDEAAEYVSHFIASAECPCCGRWGTFGWGFVHGHGTCTSCGWPATAYHFLGEGESQLRFETILWAHPSEVSAR